MSEGFIHSIKVPRLYKTAATIVRKVTEDGASLKQLVYEKNHPNLKGVFALATTTLQHEADLKDLIRKTQLLLNEPRLDPWLARVLITELLWGKQTIKGDAKPLHTILNYENKLRDILKTINQHENKPPIFKQKAQKPRYVRINTLTKRVDEAIEDFQDEGYTFLPRCNSYNEYLDVLSTLEGWVFIQDYHIPELFAFSPGTTFYNHPGYASGAIILQDKASCLPAYLLNPESNSTVLDMCAAPGMKTTHLAAIIDNRGKIFSIERDERRYKTLCDQVAGTNSFCVKTINTDALTLDENQCPNVEYILVDPSCSGSGMERLAFEDSMHKCAPGRLKSLQSFQVLLLRHALTRFPNVKRVVYSTCSVYPEENEMVVDEVLSNVGDAYQLVSVSTLLNAGWINFSSTDFNCKDNCLYAKPDVDHCNGFFVAVFERNFDVPLPETRVRGKGKKNNAQNDGNDDEEQSVEVKTEVIENGEGLEKSLNNNEGSEAAMKKKKRKKSKKHSDETTAGDAEGQKIIANVAETEENVDENGEGLEKSLNTEESEAPSKKKKSKKSKKMSEEIITGDKTEENNVEILLEKKRKSNEEESENLPKKKRKKSKLKNDDDPEIISEEIMIVDDENEEIKMDPEELNVKSKKKKQKKNKKECDLEGVDEKLTDSIVEENVDSATKKKHKKKKKHSSLDME